METTRGRKEERKTDPHQSIHDKMRSFVFVFILFLLKKKSRVIKQRETRFVDINGREGVLLVFPPTTPPALPFYSFIYDIPWTGGPNPNPKPNVSPRKQKPPPFIRFCLHILHHSASISVSTVYSHSQINRLFFMAFHFYFFIPRSQW